MLDNTAEDIVEVEDITPVSNLVSKSKRSKVVTCSKCNKISTMHPSGVCALCSSGITDTYKSLMAIKPTSMDKSNVIDITSKIKENNIMKKNIAVKTVTAEKVEKVVVEVTLSSLDEKCAAVIDMFKNHDVRERAGIIRELAYLGAIELKKKQKNTSEKVACCACK